MVLTCCHPLPLSFSHCLLTLNLSLRGVCWGKKREFLLTRLSGQDGGRDRTEELRCSKITACAPLTRKETSISFKALHRYSFCLVIKVWHFNSCKHEDIYSAHSLWGRRRANVQLSLQLWHIWALNLFFFVRVWDHFDSPVSRIKNNVPKNETVRDERMRKDHRVIVKCKCHEVLWWALGCFWRKGSACYNHYFKIFFSVARVAHFSSAAINCTRTFRSNDMITQSV